MQMSDTPHERRRSAPSLKPVLRFEPAGAVSDGCHVTPFEEEAAKLIVPNDSEQDCEDNDGGVTIGEAG